MFENNPFANDNEIGEHANVFAIFSSILCRPLGGGNVPQSTLEVIDLYLL